MKKFILFAAILFSAVSLVKADGTVVPSTSSEGKTELTVKLMPIQTITINQSSVQLLYDTEAKYKAGVTLPQEDHFKVYSTGGFTVNVNSTADLLEGEGNTDKTIDASTITVEAKSGTNSSNLVLTGVTAVPLSKEGSTLFTSDRGGVDLNFNVDYVGGTLTDYFDKLFNASSASVFKTTVTYSITPN